MSNSFCGFEKHRFEISIFSQISTKQNERKKVGLHFPKNYSSTFEIWALKTTAVLFEISFPPFWE